MEYHNKESVVAATGFFMLNYLEVTQQGKHFCWSIKKKKKKKTEKKYWWKNLIISDKQHLVLWGGLFQCPHDDKCYTSITVFKVK